MARSLRHTAPPDDSDHEIEYWLSYSDLMAGMLLVFIVILIGTLYVAQSDLEARQKQLDIQEQQLHEAQAELQNAQSELKHLNQNIADILGVRAELMQRIRERFEQTGGAISFDDATGAIRLGDNILFAQGSAILTAQGAETLNQFLPVYFDALLGDPRLREHVDRITFEGHTNSDIIRGFNLERGYLSNLKLSQERAYHTMRHALETNGHRYPGLKPLLAASGFSSSRLIYKDEARTIEDKRASRRLEIRFRLKDEEALERLKELFDQRTVQASVD